jgi:outer membrane protein OmpA-like peptidoglycan-associated protein
MKRLNALIVGVACLAAAACANHVKLKPSGSYPIFFDKGDARIPSDGKDVLEVIADAYKDGTFTAVAIDCNSDNASDDVAANYALTQKRADRTKADLVKLGIPVDVITATGKGPADPLVPGVTGDTAVSNRRCLVTLT